MSHPPQASSVAGPYGPLPDDQDSNASASSDEQAENQPPPMTQAEALAALDEVRIILTTGLDKLRENPDV